METAKNVGIWIRVSTEFQVDAESPQHHEERAKHYALSKGWNIIEVYRLDAVSGKSVMEHPETKRMLADLRGKRITGLIFSKLARVARNTKELLEFSEIFRREGGDLISLSESIDTSTPAGRLFYTMIAAMAAWEREEIAERVAASVPIRADLGKPLGGQASFGYRWEGKDFVIDEEEAPIRKLVYELFLKFKRRKTTANELNKKGYRTRNGSQFSDTTITRLLRDPTAKGQRRANYTKSLGEGKHWMYKDEKDWIVKECPAIVSPELWDECNRILDEQERTRRKPGRQSVYLLAGFVHCSCGKKMYVFHQAPVYTCKSCKNRIAVEDIDEIYHSQLQAFLLTDSDLETYLMESNTLLQEKKRLLALVQGEVSGLRRQMKEFIDMRVNRELSPERFQEYYAPVEVQLKQLEHQVPELEAEIDFLKIQYLSSDTVLEEARNLYDQWQSLPDDEKRNIIETITESVIIGKDEVSINFSYLPVPPSPNPGNSPRNLRDS
ncbi:MAG: recombinase family protein [Flaviaesturariibacter sp.]|nr:recombinase family protein [Flaviaesturariibacter sp.]